MVEGGVNLEPSQEHAHVVAGQSRLELTGREKNTHKAVQGNNACNDVSEHVMVRCNQDGDEMNKEHVVVT